MPPKRTRGRNGSATERVGLISGRMTANNGIDLQSIKVLTFDCYGTLIDWEAGILATLRNAGSGLVDVADDHLLEAYARHEARLESGPWLPYRTVLEQSLDATCADFGVSPSADRRASFGGSVADWPAFVDSAAALARLAERFDLGVITNCDDDLFAMSNEKLGQPFRWIVTAEQARSYKPANRNFELALEHHRSAARADPARRPEPVPRPCAGAGARLAHGVDRSPPRPVGRGHSPGNRHARSGRARHGDVRRDGPRLSRLPFAAR